MYDARIPDRWQRISWESATLGFWYTELLERDMQFRAWCDKGRPNVFWMTGFFNPQVGIGEVFRKKKNMNKPIFGNYSFLI